MDKLLVLIGRLSGIVGIFVCAVAVFARLLGNYYIAGFAGATLLQAGTAAVAAGCFMLLSAQTLRR
jgi:hypothetical protein